MSIRVFNSAGESGNRPRPSDSRTWYAFNYCKIYMCYTYVVNMRSEKKNTILDSDLSSKWNIVSY